MMRCNRPNPHVKQKPNARNETDDIKTPAAARSRFRAAAFSLRPGRRHHGAPFLSAHAAEDVPQRRAQASHPARFPTAGLGSRRAAADRRSGEQGLPFKVRFGATGDRVSLRSRREERGAGAGAGGVGAFASEGLVGAAAEFVGDDRGERRTERAGEGAGEEACYGLPREEAVRGGGGVENGRI
jgi:hypothetical protein